MVFTVVNNTAKVMHRSEQREIFAVKLWAAPAGRQALGFKLELGIWVGGVTTSILHMSASSLELKEQELPKKLVLLIQGTFCFCEVGEDITVFIHPLSIYLARTACWVLFYALRM